MFRLLMQTNLFHNLYYTFLCRKKQALTLHPEVEEADKSWVFIFDFWFDLGDFVAWKLHQGEVEFYLSYYFEKQMTDLSLRRATTNARKETKASIEPVGNCLFGNTNSYSLFGRCEVIVRANEC